MSVDKSGSPSCGIYMRIDNLSNMLDAIGWVRKLAFAINRASGYEKNSAVIEIACNSDNAERVRDLIPIAQENGLVAVVSGSFDPMGGDGLLLEKGSDIKTAREALGEDAIIGVVCKDKDEADEAVSLGADYLCLPADPTLITRISAAHDVMCLARGAKITNKNCAALASAGAGLVDVGDYILNHEKDILQGAVNIMHALETATQRSLN